MRPAFGVADATSIAAGCRRRRWTFWADTARIFGPLDYVMLQDTTVDDDAAATGEAVAVSSTTQHEVKVKIMGRLGIKYGGGENIIPFVKFDARSGQFSRNDRVEKNGKFENSAGRNPL